MPRTTSHSLFRWPSIALWLMVFAIALSGCEVIDELAGSDPGQKSRPSNRAAKYPDAVCYDTFSKFKAAMTKAGRSRANSGIQWHHIVGQHSANVNKFGAHDLHCTDNLVYIPTTIHHKVNGHYSTRHASGKTVRDWLKDKGFDEQYDYGVKILREHKIEL